MTPKPGEVWELGEYVVAVLGPSLGGWECLVLADAMGLYTPGAVAVGLSLRGEGWRRLS